MRLISTRKSVMRKRWNRKTVVLYVLGKQCVKSSVSCFLLLIIDENNNNKKDMNNIKRKYHIVVTVSLKMWLFNLPEAAIFFLNSHESLFYCNRELLPSLAFSQVVYKSMKGVYLGGTIMNCRERCKVTPDQCKLPSFKSWLGQEKRYPPKCLSLSH